MSFPAAEMRISDGRRGKLTSGFPAPVIDIQSEEATPERSAPCQQTAKV